MKVAYIAHPLRGDWAANIESARQYVRSALTANRAPLAPYVTLDGILDDDVAKDRELGLAVDMAVIDRCDELWLCGLRVSEGMAAEAERAFDKGIRVARVLRAADGSVTLRWVRRDGMVLGLDIHRPLQPEAITTA